MRGLYSQSEMCVVVVVVHVCHGGGGREGVFSVFNKYGMQKLLLLGWLAIYLIEELAKLNRSKHADKSIKTPA